MAEVRRRTRKEKVLNKLMEHAHTGRWTCGRTLQHPTCGGRRYDARLHDLRQDGWPIERQRCDCERCRYYKTRLYAFRLDPKEVPF